MVGYLRHDKGKTAWESRYLFVTANNIGVGWAIANAVFNSVLSALTGQSVSTLQHLRPTSSEGSTPFTVGGRIWWISREARRHMGATTHSRYKAIVAAIIESGLLYPTTLIASMLITSILDPESRGTIPVDLGKVANMMSVGDSYHCLEPVQNILSMTSQGLAPTLIIVRVAYGKSVDSVQQMISDTSIQFAEPGQGSRRRNGEDILRGTAMDEPHQSQGRGRCSAGSNVSNKDRMIQAV
ncbi:hypothetical protein PM082_002285 [Marasmius tenuissimus]|nr:hypothetical protein PM082_002285 [Marasmius tenuissimus]